MKNVSTAIDALKNSDTTLVELAAELVVKYNSGLPCNPEIRLYDDGTVVLESGLYDSSDVAAVLYEHDMTDGLEYIFGITFDASNVASFSDWESAEYDIMQQIISCAS